MSAGAPLRFLLTVIGGWIFFRSAMLAPGWWAEPGGATGLAPPARARENPGRLHETAPERPASTMASAVDRPRRSAGRNPDPAPHPRLAVAELAAPPAGPAPPPLMAAALPAPAAGQAPVALAGPAESSRWSALAWLLLRRDLGGSTLAPGGTLGGSQAGARILYRLNRDAARPLAVSGRLYAPLRRTSGAEAAIGLDWRPLAGLPLHLLAERRQALGNIGRSAFSLTLYGGHSARLPAGLRFDGYAQAGMVGLRRRDLFVDGSVEVSGPVGPVELGVAAWGAAQPGAERLDLGPRVSFRLPIGRPGVRASMDWRLRVAGDAAPDSGPALTVAADF